MKRRIRLFALMSFAVSLLASCANDSESADKASDKDTAKPAETIMPVQPVAKNVVETAIASPDHSTLVSAVTAAGFVETLSGPGPFTVFGPTNAAFDALPKGTLEKLLKPESKSDLAGILTYHVVSGKVMSSQLTDGQKIKTVNGAELTVKIKDGKVMINGANVTSADIDCSNGVIHVIDAVLLPGK